MLRNAFIAAVATVLILAGPAGAVTKKVAVAGDISDNAGSSSQNADETRNRVDAMSPDFVFELGDTQYENGTPTEYSSYWDQSWDWGPLQSLYSVKPAIGNHEYGYSNGAGWEAEFGRSRHYYDFNAGDWHVYVIDSEACAENVSVCQPNGSQYEWLKTQITNTPATDCVAAFWHHPLFNDGGEHGDITQMHDIYALLDTKAGADLILSGHEHNYQRFAKQTADGVQQNDAPKEFVVGTGGKSLYAMAGSGQNLQFSDDGHFGILKLKLEATDFVYAFESTAGVILDGGFANPSATINCTNDPV